MNLASESLNPELEKEKETETETENATEREISPENNQVRKQSLL